jgi:cobaltochelatase CobN
MRHGHRGAAEIAQSLDNLYCFAALTDAVRSEQFDLMFDATLGDDGVRAFLMSANLQAACHMAGVFEEAERRGFWQSRRNSSAQILGSILEEAA